MSRGASFVSDGERRYAERLWPLLREPHRTGARGRPPLVWPEGVVVARKVKGSNQPARGKRRGRHEHPGRLHPGTSPPDQRDIHACHLEAHHSALRRRCSAFRRRSNTYAKGGEGLRRAVEVQRGLHNWVRPHWAHQGRATPAMVAGVATRVLTIAEVLMS